MSQPFQEYFELLGHTRKIARYAREFAGFHDAMEQWSVVLDQLGRAKQEQETIGVKVAQAKGELALLENAVAKKRTEVARDTELAIAELGKRFAEHEERTNRESAEATKRANERKQASDAEWRSAEAAHRQKMADLDREADQADKAHAEAMADRRAEIASTEEQLTVLRRSLQSLKARVAEIV